MDRTGTHSPGDPSIKGSIDHELSFGDTSFSASKSTVYTTKCTYIYRVPQCMSPRRNWDSPTPSLASECAPSPGTKGGGGAHFPAGEGFGESQFRRLEKSLAFCLLCGLYGKEIHQKSMRGRLSLVFYIHKRPPSPPLPTPPPSRAYLKEYGLGGRREEPTRPAYLYRKLALFIENMTHLFFRRHIVHVILLPNDLKTDRFYSYKKK